jgi:hypothetical protein
MIYDHGCPDRGCAGSGQSTIFIAAGRRLRGLTEKTSSQANAYYKPAEITHGFSLGLRAIRNCFRADIAPKEISSYVDAEALAVRRPDCVVFEEKPRRD